MYIHIHEYCCMCVCVCLSKEEIEVGEVRLKRNAELKADEKRTEEVMQQISESK